MKRAGRAMAPRGATARTLAAAALTIAALTALLAGWSLSGWAGVRAEQASLRATARDRDERTAQRLADALDARLEALRRVEAQRPYYHYQSLYHDPRGAAEGLAVVPSPLASGPDDPLVRAHFQIDAAGRVSMPTINDDLPELTQQDELAANRALRTALTAAAATLKVTSDDETPVRVAAAEQVSPPAVPRAKKAPPPTKVVVEVAPEVYAQNAYSTDIYKQTRNQAAPQQQGMAQQQLTMPQVQALLRPKLAPKPAPTPAPPPTPPSIDVTIAPPEWRATTVAGALALALVRRVDTPDGALTQGLILDRAAAADWLAERADHQPVSLAAATARDPHVALAPLAAGAWSVAIDLRAAEAGAARAGDAVARAFLGRLVPIALLSMLCGALVIVVVARAERLAQERARFAAAAAHELRTPLAGLQLYGDMLADGLGDPGKQRDYARRMAEEASRLGRVVSNVLGFSQLERGNLSVHARPGDAAAVVHSAIERSRPALERAGAILAFEPPPGPVAARLDEDAVLRVVANLLDNAEKYSRGADDRTIRLSIAARDGAVEIAIADDGPGIPDAERRRLFHPFQRGERPDAPAGLGLGLALSRSLARAMGGELVHRPAARGATFVLILAAA